MKKVLVILLAAVALSSTLVACKDGDETETTKSLTTVEKVTVKPPEDSGNNGNVTISTAFPTTPGTPDTSEIDTTLTTTAPTTTATPTTTTGKTSNDGDQPHVHSWSEWTVSVEPTCTENGSRTRSCACGMAENEAIEPIDHNYVDGICTMCKVKDPTSSLKTLDSLDVDNVYYSSSDLIVFNKGNKCYVADRATGRILSDGYDGIKCAGSDGYVVAYNYFTEVIGQIEDEDYGTLYTTKTTTDSYVLDKNGSVIYTAKYISIKEEMGSTTYEGELVSSCNEGRMITVTSGTYHFGMAHSCLTVQIRDMSGKVLATHKEIRSVGTFIGGELVMLSDDSVGGNIKVVDKNGALLRQGLEWEDGMPIDLYDTFLPDDTWSQGGFIDGFVLIETNNYYDKTTPLISNDFAKKYFINSEYLAQKTHYGSIVASKILKDGVVSDDYYLIDLAKCTVDENGFCIPTIAAAIKNVGYDYVAFSDRFCAEKYILVSRDGKWGFLSTDGKTERLYDDAGKFYDGIAMVKDGENVFVIDESFKQISPSLRGYTSLYSAGAGVFALKVNDKTTVAVFDK